MTILQLITDYLNEKLHVPVLIKRSNDELTNFILVEKSGVSIKNFIQTTTITTESYASNLANAETLSVEVSKAMMNLIEKDEISGVKIDTDYPWQDASRKEDRYQAVFQVTHYLDD